MDRRFFNKALASLAVAPSALLGAGEWSAATAASTFNAVGHYGLTNLGITTSFILTQVFDQGQVEIFEDIEDDPKTEVQLSFYLNKERTIERTIHFKGEKKQWVALKEKRHAVEHYRKSQTTSTGFFHATGDVRRDGGIYRSNYVASEVSLFRVGTRSHVPVSQIKKGEYYDICVFIKDEDGKSHACEIVMPEYEATAFYDYDINKPEKYTTLYPVGEKE